MCPNNIVLLWIQSGVLKFGWRFSILDRGTREMSLVVLLVLAAAGFANFTGRMKNIIKDFRK